MLLKHRILHKKLPPVVLEEILFAWPGGTPENSALPLFPDTLGWSAENRSTAVYCRQETREQQILIKARFVKNAEGQNRIQVRATHVHLTLQDILTGEIVEGNPGMEVLGKVQPTTVYFSEKGNSVYRANNAFVPLPLENVGIEKAGVGIYDINWQWEYRVLSDKATDDEDVWEDRWRPLTTTYHRVYVLLSSPNFPWTPHCMPNFEHGLPLAMPVWDDALAIACDWARGAETHEQAASMITNRIFESQRLSYTTNNCYYQNHASFAYLTGNATKAEMKIHAFQLSKMIERLSEGEGLGGKANCMDCAILVMTLSNLLGCSLRIGKLQNTEEFDTDKKDYAEMNRFEVNPILAIGMESVDKTMEGLKDGGVPYFTFHAIAWQPEPGNSWVSFTNSGNLVYDACVRFPYTEDGVQKYRPATGLVMGLGISSEKDSYRTLLAANSEQGLPRCTPQDLSVIYVQVLYSKR